MFYCLAIARAMATRIENKYSSDRLEEKIEKRLASNVGSLKCSAETQGSGCSNATVAWTVRCDPANGGTGQRYGDNRTFRQRKLVSFTTSCVPTEQLRAARRRFGTVGVYGSEKEKQQQGTGQVSWAPGDLQQELREVEEGLPGGKEWRTDVSCQVTPPRVKCGAAEWTVVCDSAMMKGAQIVSPQTRLFIKPCVSEFQVRQAQAYKSTANVSFTWRGKLPSAPTFAKKK